VGIFRAEKMSQKGQVRHANVLEDGRCRALGDHPRVGRSSGGAFEEEGRGLHPSVDIRHAALLKRLTMEALTL
jgi:hypothetical protein